MAKKRTFTLDDVKEITIEKLIAAAQRGEWKFIDKHVTGEILDPSWFKWALDTGLKDKNLDVRDLAATIWNRSNEHVDTAIENRLIEEMLNADYDIVQMRLAIGLYKRGNWDTRIVTMFQRALQSKVVGKEALAIQKATAH